MFFVTAVFFQRTDQTLSKITLQLGATMDPEIAKQLEKSKQERLQLQKLSPVTVA